MRAFKKTFLLLLLIGGLLASAGFLFIQVYGDQIKDGLVSYLNQHLNTKVKAESIDLSVWRQFPKASVNFTNVRVKESLPGSEANLAVFDRAYFVLDLWAILQGNYVIEKILLEKGRVNMAIREDYTRNYRIFKNTGTTSSPDTELSLDLKNIAVNEVQFNYHNQPKSQEFRSFIEEADFQGQFQNQTFLLKAEARTLIDALQVEETAFARNKPANLSCELKINKQKGVYTLKNGNLELANAQFEITGDLRQKENGANLDLAFEGRKNRLETLLALVPEEYRKTFAAYEGTGNFYFNADLTGSVTARENPRIDVNFGIEDGTITKQGVDTELEQVNLEGEFTNGGRQSLVTTLLKLKSFKTIVNDRRVKGQVTLNNFTDPYLNLKVESNVRLADAKAFIPLEDLTELNGNLFLDAAFAGRISNLESVETVHKTNFKGDMSLRKVNAYSKSQDIRYKDLNGNFRFNGNDLLVKNFKGYVGGSNFTLNGYLRNLASFLFLEDEKLTVDADFKSKHIDLKPLVTTEYQQDAQDTVVTFALPDYLVFDLGFQCREVEYERFKAKDIQGKVNYVNEKVQLKDLDFQTMSGQMNLSGTFASKENGNLEADFNANGQDIDIEQLFYQMDDFGQDIITNKHLKGIVNTNIKFRAVWDEYFNPLYDQLKVESDIGIDNGELNNFAPIMKLSGLIDVEELKRLQFQDLKNKVIIKDRQIRIPEMAINSNAFNMDFSGVHGFDNEIKYNIRVNLSQILFGEKEDYETQFGQVTFDDEGQMNLFVKMTGPVNDPNIQYDRKAVAQKIQKDLEKEKEDLEKALEGQGTSSQEKDDYQLEWDDE